MSLETFWFIVIAVAWTGFFLLEGFDFGVGFLSRFIGRDQSERDTALRTIGPFWDGNEVWLIVGGAAIFAAFPGWYATWFSAGYLALVLVLFALIIRGVSFEYADRVEGARWKAVWRWAMPVGSFLAPLLIGVALGDLLAGLPVGSNQEFTGNFWDLLTPYGLLTGVTLTALCALHGATFLGIRTTGALRDRAHRFAVVWHAVVVVLIVVFGIVTHAVGDRGLVRSLGLPLLAAVCVIAAGFFARERRDGFAFVATAIAIGATVATVFVNLYPNVLVSSTDVIDNLTVSNTASGHYALTVMTIVAVIFLPLVLLYQGWTYWVFRQRLSGPPADPSDRDHDERTPADLL